MRELMKKVTSIVLPLVLVATFATVSLTEVPTAQAASAKEWAKFSDSTTYYGELSNGQPNGVGTIFWGDKKQYSGQFANGKRSGSGKYMNEYVDQDGKTHKVVYNGAWSGDSMTGKGTYHETIRETDGTISMQDLQFGTFKNGQFLSGYRAQHAVADPDYAFTYNNGDETLYVMTTNENMTDMVKAWKNASLFFVDYKKGSISKQYSVVDDLTESTQRFRQTSIKYLKRITPQVTPVLKKFAEMSKQIPLK